MKEINVTAKASLKEFVREDGQTFEYVDIYTEINGIKIKLALTDSTAKEIFKNKLKEIK